MLSSSAAPSASGTGLRGPVLAFVTSDASSSTGSTAIASASSRGQSMNGVCLAGARAGAATFSGVVSPVSATVKNRDTAPPAARSACQMPVTPWRTEAAKQAHTATKATAPRTMPAPAAPMALRRPPPISAPTYPPAPPTTCAAAEVAGWPPARSPRPAAATARATRARSAPVAPRRARPLTSVQPATNRPSGRASRPQPSPAAPSRRTPIPAGPRRLKWIANTARAPTTMNSQPHTSSGSRVVSSWAAARFVAITDGRAPPRAVPPRLVADGAAVFRLPVWDERDFVVAEPFAAATVRTTLTPATMRGAVLHAQNPCQR